MRVTYGRVLILVALIALWEIPARLGLVHALLLTPFSATVETLARVLGSGGPIGNFYPHLLTTLFEIVGAYAIAVCLGLVVGAALGSIRSAGDVFEPLILGFYSVPTVIFYPIVFLTLGLGPSSKIVYGAILGFFPILTSALAGIRQVDRSLITTAYAFGASPRQIAFKVVLPASAPVILSGLRLGLNLTLIGVFAGELIASAGGLGYLIVWAGSTLRIDVLFALVLLTLVLAVGGNQGLAALERRWRRA
ncbi:MAG: ABC transporter permease [Chloroflexi bacterium]|nr:ABC transporter permease [Chloroflexota bacterium]